jgi:hypothetical protein
MAVIGAVFNEYVGTFGDFAFDIKRRLPSELIGYVAAVEE